MFPPCALSCFTSPSCELCGFHSVTPRAGCSRRHGKLLRKRASVHPVGGALGSDSAVVESLNMSSVTAVPASVLLANIEGIHEDTC